MKIKNIEQIFSENEATPSFINLAHYYFENKYYKNGKYRSETLSKNTIAIKQYER